MDLEFDYKGNPVGGIITNCEFKYELRFYVKLCEFSLPVQF